MASFRIHTIESAPEASRPALRELQEAFGLIPNLAAVMAESPVLLCAFANLFGRVHAGSFNEAQIQTLLLSNAVSNGCAWAVAFHSTLALKEGVTPGDVQAIRERRLPLDVQLAALSTLTRLLIDKRGQVDERASSAFQEAGFRHDQVLEVLAVLAASTMTNYAGNIAHPPVEALFQQQAWDAALPSR